MNRFPGHGLEKTGGFWLKTGGVFQTDRRLLPQRCVNRASGEVAAGQAGVPLVSHIEVEFRALVYRARKGQTGRDHKGVVVVGGLGVGVGQLGRHLWLVGVGPGHEEHWLGAMLSHALAVLPGVLVKHRFQLWVNRALATVHHDRQIKKFVQLVKDDVVFGVERVRTDSVGSKVGVDVVPVKPRAADGDRYAAKPSLFLSRSDQLPHMVVQAVVVVEETVSDEDGGCRIFNSDFNDFGPDLGPEWPRPTQPDHQSAQQAVQCKFEVLINLHGISPEAGKFVASCV